VETGKERAMDEQQHQAQSGSFVEHLAQRVGEAASVRTVFGSPVERDGTTIVPVAAVRFGFGGGGGRKAANGQEGTGGGGGVRVSPVGFIEMCDGEVRFRRIRSGSMLLRLLGAALAAVMVVRPLLGALARRGERRHLGRMMRGLSRRQRRWAYRRLVAAAHG
jgi:uncharacterized spore protein YtfJ